MASVELETSAQTFITPDEQRFLLGDVVGVHYAESPNAVEQSIDDLAMPDYLGKIVAAPLVETESTKTSAWLHLSQVLRSQQSGFKRSADIIAPPHLSMAPGIHFALRPLSTEHLQQYVDFLAKLKA